MSQNEVGKIHYRPWGSYQTLVATDGYQLKILAVKPQGRLSLQRHAKRSERWIVVYGQPTITIADNCKDYMVTESVFIPAGTIHRLENFTMNDVKIVEVQTGSYFGEDDIERFEDIYGRI
jgi:mannose-6-phosphate isomerase-like protein (cupin superfamily)